MNARLSRRKLHGSLGLSVLVLAAILAGCFNRTPAVAERVLDPKLPLTKELSGNLFTRNPDQAISPGGYYLLAEQDVSTGYRMVAVSLNEGAGDVVLAESEDLDGFTRFVPVGWTSPTTCVFLVTGRQIEGPNKGKLGVGIMLGDVTVPKAEETGFIEVGGGWYRSPVFVEGDSRLYIRVSKALWECDLNTKSLRLVKGDFPTYDGLFVARVSPTGRYAVYNLYEEDKHGIYILDIATGEERPLLPTGATESFLPQWSPDGKYILAYTARQKPHGDELPIWERYEVFQGEDSALPIAASLTVITPEGEVVKTIEVEGKTLAHARWSRNSQTIGFLAGSPRTWDGGQGFPPNERPSVMRYDSAMVADVLSDAGPVRVADITSLPGYDDPSVDLVLVDPSEKGLYFVASTYEANSLKDSKLWYASRDKEPVAVCDGLWQFAGTEPVFGDQIAGILAQDGVQSVWLVGPDGSRLLATSENPRSWTTILGHNEDLLVVCTSVYSEGSETAKVTVYRIDSKAQKAG
jgi:hypothetical protein